MKRINEAFGLIEDMISSRFDMDEIKRDLLEDEEIRALAQEMNIDDHLVNLIDYRQNKKYCRACDGLANCPQNEQGYKPAIRKANGYVEFIFEPCQKLKESKLKKNAVLKGLHIPDRMLNIKSSDVFKDDDRSEILDYFNNFIKNYQPGVNFEKGMYLYGKPGCGKTFMMCALANELTTRGFNVVVIYYPDLIREIKSTFGDSMAQFEKIEELKKVDILMLDDIGAEKVTDYCRDEILGPILQYRMLDEKPTFFTSNLNMKQLHEHLSKSDSGINIAKGFRIHERISALANDFELNGKRYRK